MASAAAMCSPATPASSAIDRSAVEPGIAALVLAVSEPGQPPTLSAPLGDDLVGRPLERRVAPSPSFEDGGDRRPSPTPRRRRGIRRTSAARRPPRPGAVAPPEIAVRAASTDGGAGPVVDAGHHHGVDEPGRGRVGQFAGVEQVDDRRERHACRRARRGRSRGWRCCRRWSPTRGRPRRRHRGRACCVQRDPYAPTTGKDYIELASRRGQRAAPDRADQRADYHGNCGDFDRPTPSPDFDSRPEAIRRAIEARIIEGKMQPGRSPGTEGRSPEGVRRRRPDDRPGAHPADQRRADRHASRPRWGHLRRAFAAR